MTAAGVDVLEASGTAAALAAAVAAAVDRGRGSRRESIVAPSSPTRSSSTWLAIFARILLSWVPLRSGTLAYRLYSILYDATEPYLRFFRRYHARRCGSATPPSI